MKTAIIGTPDPRWTFFQAPLLVEDALGRKLPVPSEYDFDLLNGVLKLRFQKGPGSGDVMLGNYELFDTCNSKRVITANTRLLPGSKITMAILVNKPLIEDDHCPMQSCRSNRTSRAPGGGKIW
jgi:hypothetical protein